MSCKSCRAESFTVLLCAAMITTFVFQTLGFITPYWACGESYGKLINNLTDWNCTSEGLFYSCAESDGCRPQVLDSTVLGLCSACFVLNMITVPATLYLRYKQIKRKGRTDFKFKNGSIVNFCANECLCLCTGKLSTRHVFSVFVAGQVMAYFALLILRNIRVDGGWSDDWSASIFLYPSIVFGLPILIIVSILFAAVVMAILCKQN